MTNTTNYIMEHKDEALRLDLKTDRARVFKQASWAGIKPGMRVADIGCGSGKTTVFLNEMIQPGGRIVGVDASQARVLHAKETHGSESIDFVCRNFYESLDDLGKFDFIWVRFVLEYHRSRSTEIVKNLTRLLKPGGVLCLIDLDYNCLSHYGHSSRLEKAVGDIMAKLEKDHDFDPYVGKKLYSFLYDLGFEEIAVEVGTHHLIYGELNEIDAYNWAKKVEVAAKNSGYVFEDYPGGFDEFAAEFKDFFSDPRRFTYTPLICCRGVKK
jgi:ubiquinone/menaquinone biosynthesis C-methylase UbiE